MSRSKRVLSQFKTLSTPVQVTVIILILVLGSLSWWLASPLFLSGPVGDDTFDPTAEKLYTGELERIDETHYGMGTVNIVNTSGQLRIQFVDVEIANGPGLYVYLSNKSSFSGKSDSPGNYYDIGKLKAQSGSFVMDIPLKPDFEIGSVMIWCDPFNVVFSFATMTPVT